MVLLLSGWEGVKAGAVKDGAIVSSGREGVSSGIKLVRQAQRTKR